MARHVVSLEARRRHAYRVAAGLLPAALGLPSMSHEDRDRFLSDIDQRGLTDELASIVKEEQTVDAAGARDLRDEDTTQADQCRRRGWGWRAARRLLRRKPLRPSVSTGVVTSSTRPHAKRSRRRATVRGPDGEDGGAPTANNARPVEPTAEGLATRLAEAYGTSVTPDEAREMARNVDDFLSILADWERSDEREDPHGS